MLENLNNDQIEHILHTQIIGRLGCHNKDTIYVVPISYAYDGTYIYSLTHAGQKIDLMRENPQVCFEVEHIPDLANWESVICWGEYEELVAPDQRVLALEILHNRSLPAITSETTKISPIWPFRPHDIDKIKGIVYRIRLTKKTGKYEKLRDQSTYLWGY